MSSVIWTAIGAGVKLLTNIINHWLEGKRQNQLLLAAKDDKFIKGMIDNQHANSRDPFVKATRRVLFISVTLTLCFLMIYYAMNPHITYNVVVPNSDGYTGGLFGWFTGNQDFTMVQMTGGLLLKSFMDMCFMIVGFYAVPSKLR